MSDKILRTAPHHHNAHSDGRQIGGMVKVTRSGFRASGGDHASALDSLSGNVVVPGLIKTAPGYGNSGMQSGHPLAKAPAGKNLKQVAVSPGMRSRTQELGHAIKAQALLKGGSNG
jgi:hypothetical protein